MGKSQSGSLEAILPKIYSYCAFQERCTTEVLQKLESFNLNQQEKELIIDKLRNDHFIDDLRFAKSFAGGKFRLKKWGKFKIRYELMMRHIEETQIELALNEIEENDYLNTINTLVINKIIELKGEDRNIIREKTVKYLQSKGFELDLVLENLSKNLKNINHDNR